MFFEGPEKKIEISVVGKNLRELPREFWQVTVQLSGAQILSEVRGSHCDAYLLSESSLFVYKDHLVMITCGRTTLVNAAIHCVQNLGFENIESFIFERKNEIFPYYQHSNFFDDVQKLRALIPGRALRFGREDEHHVLLFHYEKGFKPESDDCTLEILMHGIQDEASCVFTSSEKSRENLDSLGVREVLPGFTIDDHIFEPCGYSLNGIKDKFYYTIHVTPEPVGSYVSFETNLVSPDNYMDTIKNVLAIFKPRSFDIVLFTPVRWDDFEIPGYHFLTETRAKLGTGYETLFATYFNVDDNFHPAYEFKEF